jgi:hypothetical protein
MKRSKTKRGTSFRDAARHVWKRRSFAFKRKGQRGDPDTIPSAGTNQSLRRSKPRSSAKCPRSQIKSAMDARRLCRNRVGCPGNVFGFVDHAYNPKPRILIYEQESRFSRSS